jgi:hypothetical protein
MSAFITLPKRGLARVHDITNHIETIDVTPLNYSYWSPISGLSHYYSRACTDF